MYCIQRKSEVVPPVDADADAMGWDTVFCNSFDEEAVQFDTIEAQNLTIVFGAEREENSVSFLDREAASINDALFFANPTLSKYKDEDQNAQRAREVGEGLRRPVYA